MSLSSFNQLKLHYFLITRPLPNIRTHQHSLTFVWKYLSNYPLKMSVFSHLSSNFHTSLPLWGCTREWVVPSSLLTLWWCVQTSALIRTSRLYLASSYMSSKHITITVIACSLKYLNISAFFSTFTSNYGDLAMKTQKTRRIKIRNSFFLDCTIFDLFFEFIFFSGSYCWSEKHLPYVPPLPWGPAFVCED